MRPAGRKFAAGIGAALAVIVCCAASVRGSDEDLLKVSSPAAQVQSVDAQTAADVSGGSLHVRQVGLALAAVIAAIFILRWVGQRVLRGGVAGRNSKAISVLSRTVLSPRQQVMLLQVGKRLLVVGDSGGQMAALCEITDADEVAALIGQLGRGDGGSTKTFASLFRGGDVSLANAPAVDSESQQGETGSEPGREVAAMHEDIRGLLGKVRLLRDQFKTTESGT